MIGIARFARTLAAALALLATGMPQAPQPDPGRRAADRLRALQREADGLARQERTLLGDLRRLEVERDLRAVELKQLEGEMAAIARERGETDQRLLLLERRAETARPGLHRRMVELYKLGRAGYLRLLLDVNDVRALGRAYRTVTTMAEQDRRRVAAYRDTLVQLRAATTSLEERGARLQALQQQAVTARQAAARAVANRAALVAEIDARRDLNAQLIGELQAAAERLGSLAPAAVSSASVILPIRPFRGDLDWPAAGRLAARFGRQRDARFGTTVLRSGVSIAAPPGSPARAVHEGVVAYAEPFPGYGNLVILDHGSQAYSLYGYLGTIDAQKGARVNRGQAVGTIGTAPAGGAELYFELRIDGKPVDPVQWLKQR